MTSPSRRLALRPWVPGASETRVDEICAALPCDTPSILDTIDGLSDANTRIHEVECVNLNPATNTMSPRATAALRANLSSRTSLGYAGAKYEMGLEAIEQIEVVAAELAALVFNADDAEIRVPSGAMANLYAFMATTKPGDSIIVPPASIAGHAT
jgi:glycine hydroxymethyltransferase